MENSSDKVWIVSVTKPKTREDRYLVESVLRACDILEAFKSEGELLRIRDVAQRTGLGGTTTLRLLYTLERRGLIERVGSYDYRLAVRPLKKKSFRLGYGSQSNEFAFSRAVAEGLTRAAAQEGVDLIVLDNRYSPKTAIRNVERFIRERVDLMIEFQTDEHLAAPVIAAKLMEANIPLIAVEIPHPGATYFGANNYAAGLMGGRYLGRWAKQRWGGHVDEILLLELPMSGPIPASRLTGTLVGIREVLGKIGDGQIVKLNGNGRFGSSLEAVRKHLRRRQAKHVLVTAINDPSAIGALRAFEEIGRSDHCAVIGQNASADARAELRRNGSRLLGSVGYFPEQYGNGILALALDILHKKSVPPAIFVKHHLVTAENVNHYYPNDSMTLAGDPDLALLR
jgi:ribose transport system substrate-binding protein